MTFKEFLVNRPNPSKAVYFAADKEDFDSLCNIAKIHNLPYDTRYYSRPETGEVIRWVNNRDWDRYKITITGNIEEIRRKMGEDAEILSTWKIYTFKTKEMAELFVKSITNTHRAKILHGPHAVNKKSTDVVIYRPDKEAIRIGRTFGGRTGSVTATPYFD